MTETRWNIRIRFAAGVLRHVRDKLLAAGRMIERKAPMAGKASIAMAAQFIMHEAARFTVQATSRYEIECFAPDGTLKWREDICNLVVTTGLNELLDKTFKASTYTAAWYVGITAGSPTFAAGDTMASHAGWTEQTIYSESNRPTLTLGTVSSGSVNNSANKAVFTFSSGGTIGGAFVTTNNTKGGSTGTLYGGAAFSANRTVATNDVLNVTVTLTITAS